MTDAVETHQLRGSTLAKHLHLEVDAAKRIFEERAGHAPVLATLLVGEDGPALAYRGSIDRTFRKVNIEHRHVELPGDTTPDELVAKVDELNHDDEITGVLVLMPLPKQLDPHLILEHLSPLKDVDGITPTNAGRLHLGLPSLRPSTPAGGIELLDFYNIPIEGTDFVVVGRSNVIGRPLGTLLSHRSGTVTQCHSRTKNLEEKLKRADVVCLAAGHKGLVTGDMLRPGSIVIDFGVNVDADGKMAGDAVPETLEGVASAYTPVPGGTGPVTAMVLARNVLAAGFAQLNGTLDSLPELRHLLDMEVPEEKATV